MKLKNRSGDLGGDGTEEGLFHNFFFLRAVSDKKDAFGLHNRHHSHSDGLGGNLVAGSEETGICLDGRFVQVDEMSLGDEAAVGLVKADMTVESDTEKLNIDTAKSLDMLVVGLSFLLGVGRKTVRYEGTGFVDVDSVKKGSGS